MDDAAEGELPKVAQLAVEFNRVIGRVYQIAQAGDHGISYRDILAACGTLITSYGQSVPTNIRREMVDDFVGQLREVLFPIPVADTSYKVGLSSIFFQPALNRYASALRVFAPPENGVAYTVWMQSNKDPLVGFFSRAEIVALRDALNKAFAS